MSRATRFTSALAAVALLAVGAANAQAHPRGDGRIVFDDGDGPLYSVNPDGSDLTQIGFGHDLLHFSTRGDRLAMSAEGPDGRITTALARADGSGLVTQPIPDPTLNLVCWAWQPSDAGIACEAWDDVRPERTPGIFAVRVASWAGLVRLTANPYGGHDIPGSYSPDGDRIAFMRENPAAGGLAVFVACRDGSRARRVSDYLPDPSGPDWSPDGRRLIYSDGEGALLTVRPDGGDRHVVGLRMDSAAQPFAFQPAWSPDGRRIVFGLVTPRPDGAFLEGIYTARSDGSDVRAVATTTTGLFNNPDWGPAK